jgi:hypothetical protein
VKRNWIKVRNGLLDPKHIKALGFCPVILYLYMLDGADWDTGMIIGWVDGDAAEVLGVETWQVKKFRNRLKREKYIQCKRAYHGQNITINKWDSPFGDKSSGAPQSERKDHSVPHSTECIPKYDNHSDKTQYPNCMSTSSETIRLKDIKSGAKTAPDISLETEVDVMTEPKKIGEVIKSLDWVDAQIKYAKPPDSAARFPEEVREVIREFIRLWKVEPLSGQMSDWIISGRELNQVCGEYGLRAMKQAHDDYNNNPSYMVSRPGSVVKAVQAAAAKMRKHAPEQKVCIWCKGTGMETVKSDPLERHEDGRVIMVDVPCTHCGKESQ